VQYEADTVELGYKDARVTPEGKLSSEEAANWSAGG
jgi:hypothetical protein